MERREHDIFMDMLVNPTASFDTMVAVGLTPKNTSLQDKSVYEGNSYVQEYFKNSDGDFDKKKFEQAYTTAKSYYNVLSLADFDESMKKQITWHRDSMLGLEGNREKGPRYQEFNINNPSEQIYGLSTLGRVENPTKSLDEIAQTHKVLANPTTAGENLENAKWEDSPNDSFFSHFTDTLVIAQWDSDGEHINPITGEKEHHEKGQPKLNQDGEYFYEKLDGRDVYGRRVLNKMNVLTTDGSWANKFDFFDSDDIAQKSFGGTVLKNLALIGSMFIPYVGPWIAGLSVAVQSAGFLATLGKMIVGSDDPTFNEIEGWAKSLNRQTAKTEYAQQNTWCWENLINLIGDVMGQLKEQRFLFETAPALLKGANMATKEGQALKLAEIEKKYKDAAKESIEKLTNNGNGLDFLKKAREISEMAPLKAQAEFDSFLKGYNKLGEVLSKGYMTAITVGDTFGEAKSAGASDLDATLLTLGYAAGEYALLNTGIGEWILPELRASRYKMKAIRDALLKLDDNASAAVQNASREVKQNYVKKIFNIGKNIANANYVNGSKTLKASIAAGAGEGVEEVSEELLADFSKACYDTVKWLQGSDIRVNTFGYDFEKNKWNSKEVLDRYGMSLIGGAIGGSLTNTVTNYKTFKQLDNMDAKQAYQELVYMYRNGELDKFEKSIDKATIANVNDSATDFEVKEDGTILYAPGTKENNKDLFAKQILHQQVKIVRDIASAAGAKISDNSLLAKQTELLGDLRFNALHKSTTAGGLVQEFNTLTADIVQLTNTINSLQNKKTDSNEDGVSTDKEKRDNVLNNSNEEEIKTLEKELSEKKKQLKDIVEGKRNYEFISTALFEMTPELSGVLTTVTFPLYVESLYGRKYTDLTENEKAEAWKKYENWKTGEGREKIKTIAQVFLNLNKKASDTIIKHGNDYINKSKQIQVFTTLVNNIFGTISGESSTDWLADAQNSYNFKDSLVSNHLINAFGTESDKAELQSILSRLKNIDPSMTIEDKQALGDQVAHDLKNKQIEILLSNIDKYFKPFIENGNINSQIKSQLLGIVNNLINLVIQRAEGSYDDMGRELPEKEIYESQKEKLEEYYNKIKSLENTAFEKNLNEFAISIGANPINITQLIEKLNEILKSTSSDITKFNMSQEVYSELNNAINTIKMYQLAIKAARTDNVNFDNYFGFNATLNQIGEAEKNPRLAEIDKNVADIFIVDINTNLIKLNFLKQLYQINQGQKMSRQDRIAFKKDILIYKRLRSIVTIPDDDPLKKWNGFLELQATINGAVLHNKYINEENVSEKDREEFEKEKLSIETAIYDFFQKNQDALYDVNKLIEFINLRHFQLYTEANQILNEDTQSIDDNSILWWIAGRAAVNAKDFYWQYQQILDSKAHIAPIATQELAVFNNYASIVNGKVFDQFYIAARQAVINDWKDQTDKGRKSILKGLSLPEEFAKVKYDDFSINFLPIPKYKNVIFTEGIAGSGKTSAVLLQVVELLKKFNPNIIKKVALIHGALEESAKDLQNATKTPNENVQLFGHDSWMKKINSSWKPSTIDQNTKNPIITNYGLTTENEIRSTLHIDATEDVPSLIIIDEVTKFTSFEMDQINEFAEKYGITVLACGDFDQVTTKGEATIKYKGDDIIMYPHLSRTNFIRSPKLGVSMRTDNSLKTRNQQVLQTIMQFLSGINDKTDISLECYWDENGLYGDEVILYQDQLDSGFVDFILSEIDKLIKTLEPNQKIGYIYNDKNSILYQKLQEDKYKPFIDFKENGAAQGLEGRYYIIESDQKNHNSVKEYLQEVYTGITRAIQGSLLITSANSVPKFLSKEVSVKIDESVPDEVYEMYTNKRRKLLSKIIPQGTKIEITPRLNKTTTEVKTGNIKTGELNDGIDPTPPAGQVLSKTVVTIPPVDTFKIYKDSFEIKEFDSIPENLRDDVLKAQKEAINHPKIDEDFEENDTKSDLKYGQIVNIQGEYGVIVGIKLHADGNHTYEILKASDSSRQSYKRENFTEIISSPDVQSNIVRTVTQDELENRCGPTVFNKTVTFDIGNVSIIAPFIKIPFKNKTEQGECNIINLHDNIITALKLGSEVQYFVYRDGKWLPFQGINSDGTITNIIYPENTIFESIVEVLNKGLPIIDPKVYPVDTENLSNIEESEDYVWDDIIGKIYSSIDELLPDVVDPGVQSLVYEDNEAPITDQDFISEEEFNDRLDSSNETEKQPQNKVDDNSNLVQCAHTFNTFETGVLYNGKGEIFANGGKEYMESRRDSVNGLIFLDKILGKDIKIADDGKVVGGDVKNIEDYKYILGRCRSLLFNISNKSDLVVALENELGIKGIYLTFGLKCSPRFSNESTKDTEFVEKTPTPFSKGKSESTEYNGSHDANSQNWHSKTIVAIIGTQENGDILELPLLALTSPITLLKSYEGKVFPDMYKEYNDLKSKNFNLYQIASKLYEDFKDIDEYREIAELFGLFCKTDRNISFIKDPNWTPSKDLENLGATFVLDRGRLHEMAGLSFNSFDETEWITVENYKNNHQIYVTQNIFVGTTSTANSLGVKKGHPFVLVSHDLKLNTDEEVVKWFEKQRTDPSVQKKVSIMYIRPPRATIEEYFDNVQKILRKESGVKPIGQLFTSYHLISDLIESPEFCEMLKTQRSPKLLVKVQQVIKELKAINNLEELKNALYQPSNWSEFNIHGTPKLAGIFDGILSSLVYNRTSSAITGGDPVYKKNEDNLNLIVSILNSRGKGNIYYNAYLPRRNKRTIGSFSIMEHSNYTIDGKPYLIHGKLDSYTFRGYFGGLIHQYLSELKPTKDNVHEAGPDASKYINHKSNIFEKEDNAKQKFEKIVQKSGINLTKLLIDNFLLEDYRSKEISELLPKIVEIINSNVENKLAFIVDGNIHISDNNTEFSAALALKDDSNNTITDLTPLFDNTGVAHFNMKIKDETYKVEYNKKTREFTYFNTDDVQEKITPLNEVLPDAFSDYNTWSKTCKDAINEVDPELLVDDNNIKGVLESEDLYNYMNKKYVSTQDPRAQDNPRIDALNDILNGLDPNNNSYESYKKAIQDLINLELWKINQDDSKRTCKINKQSIKI